MSHLNEDCVSSAIENSSSEGQSETEIHPKLWEFCDREEAGLPSNWLKDAAGVLVADQDLIEASRRFPSRKRWHRTIRGGGRRTEDKKYSLEVFQLGRYWFVFRREAGRRS